MHIKNVLVPVDFSPPSTLAVNCGIQLARRLRAKLMLLHVVESPGALMYTFPTEAEKVEQQCYEQAERLLPALVGPEDQDDLDLHVMVRKGEIDQTIRSVATEYSADIVVMGTHGRGLVGRFLIGSVTERLLRNLPVPVLAVCRVSGPLEFKRTLFATDLSESSKQGFRYALDLASETGSKLIVMHVLEEVSPITYETPDIVATLAEARRRLLEDTAAQFTEFEMQATKRKVEVEKILTEGDPAEMILKAAAENVVDLIILNVERKGRFERAILGSTAERVVREASAPVLSVPVNANVSTEEHTVKSNA